MMEEHQSSPSMLPVSTTISPCHPSPANFIGDEDDPLIPTNSAIHRTFHDGKATWEKFLARADEVPHNLWPAGASDPYLMLMDVPSLPQNLPQSEILKGRPNWQVPHVESEATHWENNEVHGSKVSSGRLVKFYLEYEEPIHCRLSPEETFVHLKGIPEVANSLAVLAICWSYIFSVKLIEMRGESVQYTACRLRPQNKAKTGNATIQLHGASPALVRWLCAILSPKLGWSSNGRGYPPWTTLMEDPIDIILPEPVSGVSEIAYPPSSAEAVELLLELCSLCNLGTRTRKIRRERWEPLSPCRAGFLAALVLPLYNWMELTPQFPRPQMTAVDIGTSRNYCENPCGQYYEDLRYFMTLSLHPESIGSIVWSIFWQPDVDCNLASPWLASSVYALGSAIEDRDVKKLVTAFALRRPRVAPWWLALFLGGDLSIFDWFQRYTEFLFEKPGFASLSAPDPMVSAWAGSKQSFLDEECPAYCENTSIRLSRADLLRHRFRFKLQDTASMLFAWQPFGCIEKKDVEIELWPYLSIHCSQRYKSFTWYLEGRVQCESFGFREETKRSVMDAKDDFGCTKSVEEECQEVHHITAAQSQAATLKMIELLCEDSTNQRSWSNTAMTQEIKDNHPWLRDWEGLG